MIAASLLLIAGAVTLLVTGLWQSSSALLGASIAASVLAAVTLIVGARRLSVGPPHDGGDPHRTAPEGDPPGRTLPALAGQDRPDRTVIDGALADRAPADRGYPDRVPDSADTQQIPVVPRGRLSTTTIPMQAPASESHTGSAAGATAQGPGRDLPAGGTQTPVLDPVQEPALDEALDPALDPSDEPPPQQVSAADAARVGQMLTEVLVVDGRPRYHLPGCVHLLGRESEPLPVGEAIELGFSPCSLCEPDSALLADARRV